MAQMCSFNAEMDSVIYASSVSFAGKLEGEKKKTYSFGESVVRTTKKVFLIISVEVISSHLPTAAHKYPGTSYLQKNCGRARSLSPTWIAAVYFHAILWRLHTDTYLWETMSRFSHCFSPGRILQRQQHRTCLDASRPWNRQPWCLRRPCRRWCPVHQSTQIRLLALKFIKKGALHLKLWTGEAHLDYMPGSL